MIVWIGTSGFQYPEWKGTFYPESFPASRMLSFYGERFSSTEINYSFRRIPSLKTLERWSAETPPRFTFSLKAPQKVTHFAKLRDCRDTLEYFHQTVSILERKLGPILFQLPPSMQKDRALLESFLVTLPAGMRAAFEFRHGSWFDDDILAVLRAANAALCIADSEKIAAPDLATASFGYLRLRREDYTAADLQTWSGRIRAHEKSWSEVFVYFKHEESGVGPKFAAEMAKLLEPTSDV